MKGRKNSDFTEQSKASANIVMSSSQPFSYFIVQEGNFADSAKPKAVSYIEKPSLREEGRMIIELDIGIRVITEFSLSCGLSFTLEGLSASFCCSINVVT